MQIFSEKRCWCKMIINKKIKVIKGIVFFDFNINSIYDDGDKPLKGFKVNLFYVYKMTRNRDRTVTALKERLIFSTRTNNKGEFSFTVPEGNYSLSLDINSIPEGLGTIKTDILVLAGNHSDNIVYFPLRKVETIETDHSMRKLYTAGDAIELNFIPRDKHGNALIAKVKYSCDDPKAILKDNILRTNTIPVPYKEYTITASSGKTKKDFNIRVDGYYKDKLCAIRSAFNNGFIDENTKISLYLKSIMSNEKQTWNLILIIL